MGIRFYCPNGHKLNVKEFQAGKKGICPYCGAKIRIPLESTRKSSRETAEDVEHDVSAGADLPEALPALPEPLPTIQSDAGGGPAAGMSQSAAKPPTQVPQQQAPVGQPRSAAQQMPARQQVPLQSQPAAPVDPLVEAPDSVWYVRPGSGGQFGPASADVMRQWLGQGRISGDSLVWREGWADWQEAGVVFPQLGGSGPKVPPVEPTPPAEAPVQQTPESYTQAPEAPAAPQQPVTLYPIRRKTNSSAIIVVCLLSVLVIVLITVFVIVWNRQSEETSAPRTARPAVARIETGDAPADTTLMHDILAHVIVPNSHERVGLAGKRFPTRPLVA